MTWFQFEWHYSNGFVTFKKVKKLCIEEESIPISNYFTVVKTAITIISIILKRESNNKFKGSMQ